MEFLYLFSISWMAICIVLSIPLCRIIYIHIHKKPLVEITIIDLVYSDCIFLMFWMCIIFAIGVSACLLSETSSLSFSLSLIISLSSFFPLCNCLWSLTISGILRFISIFKNSEQVGIQSLGPDYIAIWKIRLISMALTSSLILIGLLFSNAYPASFYTLYNKETNSEIYKIYWIPVISATLTNTASKLYKTFLARQLFTDVQEKYAFSLETSLLLPIGLLLSLTTLFTTRMERLLYYDPLLVMCACNIVPLWIIVQSKSMYQHLIGQYREHMLFISVSFKKCRTTAVSPINCNNTNVDIEMHM